MKCSILIKYHKRPNLMRQCLLSIFAHSDPNDIEVLVRYDDDDETAASVISTWSNNKRIKFFPGPKELGYASISKQYGELNDHAQAPWCLYLNDDMTIRDESRKGWPDRLPDASANCLVQAQWHHISKSRYLNAENTGAPIARRHVWREFGYTELPHPFDTAFYSMYKEAKLPIVFLHAFHTIHNWLAPDASAI